MATNVPHGDAQAVHLGDEVVGIFCPDRDPRVCLATVPQPVAEQVGVDWKGYRRGLKRFREPNVMVVCRVAVAGNVLCELLGRSQAKPAIICQRLVPVALVKRRRFPEMRSVGND